jgi:hypothetical protein
MKKLFVSAALLAGALAMYGQGIVSMNTAGGGVNCRVSLVGTGGETVYPGTNNLTAAGLPAGTPFFAALYGGTAAGSLAICPTNGAAQTLATFGTTAGQNGFILTSTGGSQRAVPGVAGGQNAVIQLQAWSGNYATMADFLAAYNASTTPGLFGYAGMSQTLTVGPLARPGTTDVIPTLKDASTGVSLAPFVLTAYIVPIPEPSTLALVGLGLMGLIFIRRRK